MRAACGRADIVRIVDRLPPDRVVRAAALLGFEQHAEPELSDALDVADGESPVLQHDATVAGEMLSVPLLRLEEATFADDAPAAIELPGEAQRLTPADLDSHGRSLFATPPSPPLTPWRRLWPSLRERLQGARAGHDPDVPALLRALGRGAVVRRIPRLVRRAWTTRLSLWLDRSARLAPFFSDQVDVMRRLKKAIGKGAVRLRLLDAQDPCGASLGLAVRCGDGYRPDPDTPVLVLGDLGAYASDVERAAWRSAAARLRTAGVRVSALTPVPEGLLGRAHAGSWNAIPWERRASSAHGGPASRAGRAEQLLRLASPAIIVQPGLLRALRQLLPASHADASTEVDAWNHVAVRAADPSGFVLHDDARERMRAELVATVDAEMLRRVSATIGRWHRDLPLELLHGETLAWHALVPPSVAPPPGDLGAAQAFVRSFATTIEASDGDPAIAEEMPRFGRVFLASMPAAAYTDRATGATLERIWAAAFGAVARAGMSRVAVLQVGAQIVFEPAPERGAWPARLGAPGSPLAWLSSASPRLSVVRGKEGRAEQVALREGLSMPLQVEDLCLQTDRCSLRMRPWSPEPWASGAGRDRFGLWADVDVKGVVQRFRWIPPGRFRMGSPESEAGRSVNEGPQHVVTWTTGRWLADTPVTQALWRAVMGKNPSLFRSPDRPVEQVSWDDCQRFVGRLNALLPGLDARLPSEAEWEYGCRAGTETATWVGDLEIRGVNDAPLLDSIAWNRGNCGVDFELEQGHDIAFWAEKQLGAAKGGTHPVKRKAPNPLGLFDMLGNVLEWCADRSNFMEGYASGEEVIDPRANAVGSTRVSRGGSWCGDAAGVRAAYRGYGGPGDRLVLLGLRLARGQAPGSVAERGTQSGPVSRGAGRDPRAVEAWDTRELPAAKRKRRSR